MGPTVVAGTLGQSETRALYPSFFKALGPNHPPSLPCTNGLPPVEQPGPQLVVVVVKALNYGMGQGWITQDVTFLLGWVKDARKEV